MSREPREVVEAIEGRLSSIETEAVRIRALAELITDANVRAAIIECCSAVWNDVIGAGEDLKELG